MSDKSPFNPPESELVSGGSGSGGTETSGLEPLPWEARSEHGLLRALLGTVKLFVTDPEAAWARTRRKGDTPSPVLFVVAMSVATALAQIVWQSLFPPELPVDDLGEMPTQIADIVRAMFEHQQAFLFANVILLPVLYVIGSFVGAGVYHIALLMTGSLKGSRAGYEGTLRASCYSHAAGFLAMLPQPGVIALLLGMAVLLWRSVLTVMGAAELHNTTILRAVLAFLLQFVFYCSCFALAAVAGVLAVRSLGGLAG